MAFQDDDDIRQVWRDSVRRVNRIEQRDFAECSHANERKGDGLTQDEAIRKYGVKRYVR